MKSKIKAIFFDFDMTLVNSTKLAKKSYAALSKIAGIKPSLAGFDEYIGRRVSESLHSLALGPWELVGTFRQQPSVEPELRASELPLIS